MPSSVVSDGRGRGGSGGSLSIPPQASLMQQQITQYRLTQQKKMQEPISEPEPEPNYFEVSWQIGLVKVGALVLMLCRALIINQVDLYFARDGAKLLDTPLLLDI